MDLPAGTGGECRNQVTGILREGIILQTAWEKKRMMRQYLKTERAHFMCPNMHFGILMELGKDYDSILADAAFSRLAGAHPFLRSLIAYEEGTDRLYYNVTGSSKISVSLKEDLSSLWDDYRVISGEEWNVFENGLLKVFIYPGEQGMSLLFIAHHLLADGRGLLDLAREFAADYAGGIFPAYAEEVLMQSIDDLPPKSRLSGISRFLVRGANRQWKKENHRVSYEQYKNFAEDYCRTHPVKHEVFEADTAAVAKMSQLCRENGFSMNDLLMAHMFVKTGAGKIIIAADIRKKLTVYRKGALGNYSTAMGIQCSLRTKDVVKKAREVHEQVRKRLGKNRDLMLVLACYFEMSPTLLDAAAISALGGFDSKAGRFVGKRMFGFGGPGAYSITNLGKVEDPDIRSLVFIPPASPAVKLTLGVITLNGRMKVCSSRKEKDGSS
jgi:NRPS condensation-like uncharacterized protein